MFASTRRFVRKECGTETNPTMLRAGASRVQNTLQIFVVQPFAVRHHRSRNSCPTPDQHFAEIFCEIWTESVHAMEKRSVAELLGSAGELGISVLRARCRWQTNDCKKKIAEGARQSPERWWRIANAEGKEHHATRKSIQATHNKRKATKGRKRMAKGIGQKAKSERRRREAKCRRLIQDCSRNLASSIKGKAARRAQTGKCKTRRRKQTLHGNAQRAL